MSDAGGDAQEALARRVAALEEVVAELQNDITTVISRDLPLLKGTVRAMADTDIETVHQFPDAGRAMSERLAEYDERLSAVEGQLETLHDIDDEPSSKKAKFAAVLAFAANKHSGNGKVALSLHEIKGCTGVSRRYAYELIETMAGCIDGGERPRTSKKAPGGLPSETTQAPQCNEERSESEPASHRPLSIPPGLDSHSGLNWRKPRVRQRSEVIEHPELIRAMISEGGGQDRDCSRPSRGR